MCICVPKEQLNSGTHPSMQNYNKQHSFQICDHLDSFGGLFSRRHMCIINHYQNKSHISHIKEQSVLTENSQIYSQKDINLCSEFPANHRTMVTHSCNSVQSILRVFVCISLIHVPVPDITREQLKILSCNTEQRPAARPWNRKGISMYCNSFPALAGIQFNIYRLFLRQE